ncbi:FG-GAP repeat protein [Spongiivirga sp. MCCC 1A20706]|uniref:hypothetical protein n=1 Tax=Spongiivirga sp. MCCC 1A20706 TaxID=3160963 RepID=UPI0039774605
MKRVQFLVIILFCFVLTTSCNKDEKELPQMEESGENEEEPTEEEPDNEEPDDNSESNVSPFGDNPILMEYSPPVNGEEGDTSGSAIALSGDGGTMIVGSPGADVTAGTSGGLVRVYNHNGGWGEFGLALESPQANKNFGTAVSLNEAGTILAIGDSASHLSGESLSGMVRIFLLSGGAWKQHGNDIYGVAKSNGCGFSVALSASGNRIVAGSPYNDDVAEDAGHVRVFDLVGNTWQQVGNSIEGTSKNDLFGKAVAISDDGETIAVGGSDVGSVSIYKIINGIWTEKGNGISSGTTELNRNAIALSGNGNTLAIGADRVNSNKGRVRIYQYENDTWVAKGSAIDGLEAGDRFGNAVGINQNGSVVVVGAERSATNGNNAGATSVFHYKNGNWKPIGDPIPGQKGSYQGFSVAINSKGDVVASGAWAWSELDNGSATGQVVSYKIE